MTEQETEFPAARSERLRTFRKQGGVFQLGAKARVRVSGPDAFRYLNGQLSNDISKVSAQRSMKALLLTAKGKLCAMVHVWKEDETYLLEAGPELSEALMTRIDRYLISDDVTLQNEDTPDAGWHVFGSSTTSPEERLANRLGVEGFDTLTPPSGLLSPSREEFELLRIERGIPVWGRELNEEVLPQEARLEIEAVDFHKGCYVGQETVSRIKSVGRTNRILVGLTGDFPVKEELALRAEDVTVGKITSAARDFELARTVALGYVKTRLEQNSFRVVDSQGSTLGEATIHELPLA